MLNAVWALACREWVRFYRQRARIVSSLLTPFFLLLFFGTGLQAAFPGSTPANGENFLQYFFIANLVMTVLFTSVFSAISLIEDRHQGFLQGVLVSPVSRLTILLGKVVGATGVAAGQGVLFLLLAPVLGIALSWTAFLGVSLFLVCIALSLAALGHFFAWRFDSVQSFHSVMNLVLLPMWILSGAFFPFASAPPWLKVLMYLNPLTYGVSGIKAFLFGAVNPSMIGVQALILLGFGTLFSLMLAFEMKKVQEVPA